MSTARLLQRSLRDVRAQRNEDQFVSSASKGMSDDVWQHDLFEATHATHPCVAPSKGPGTKILVKDVHYEVAESDLEALLGKIGPIAKGPFRKVRIRTIDPV